MEWADDISSRPAAWSYVSVQSSSCSLYAKGESHRMEVVVVDDSTPFKQKGLLGADFLRRTRAILDLDRKTLKFNLVVLPLKERTDISTIVVSCCQVEYEFDELKYNATAASDITVYAHSQRIIQASVSHTNGKGGTTCSFPLVTLQTFILTTLRSLLFITL